ncbi:2-nitropropane dioxygenase [Wallemia mellicola]|uniref:2-nitropropane dioxygenase n=1 Tax=Wallemia mellicola TaxID=1708541 RepID=A0A4T0QVI5_9BASI|nr:hypothetical protein E3Q23_02764 [Wallemia mellicola]TIB76518.1 2-nitropropane dioxygenase [Wallemia mellicola]TIB88178.1 2-nitropropane dioxygenase [Wallemia mellicola]TIC09663.1 2-nitropropane dioxygenase [Wallemia mellicola]TIC27009.1 2-nitropropane dioxygenase [Wallemia mellicola]
MNVAAGSKLAAAVSNAGGIGVLGGLGYTPKNLQHQIDELKAGLVDKNLPFGVDLLLPKVGEGARKTNYDYTKGQLPELLDVIIKNGAKVFVCAVGVPPKFAVDKLHEAGIPVANMIGHPKHAQKAIDAGVDILIAQGGGGHTGDVPTSVLIPTVVEAVQGVKSPLTGKQIQVVASGGIYNSKGLAAALSYGASGVWVGTRFVASAEAAAPKYHKDLVLKSTWDDNIRTLIYTGRPLRVYGHDYVKDWEENRRDEIKELTSKGLVPHEVELEKRPEISAKTRMWLMGKVSGSIDKVETAKEIVDEMVTGAARIIQENTKYLSRQAKL